MDLLAVNPSQTPSEGLLNTNGIAVRKLNLRPLAPYSMGIAQLTPALCGHVAKVAVVVIMVLRPLTIRVDDTVQPTSGRIAVARLLAEDIAETRQIALTVIAERHRV
jgi:hypothetical protein